MRQACAPSRLLTFQGKSRKWLPKGWYGLCLLLILSLSQHLNAATLEFSVPDSLAELQPNPHALINTKARKQLERIFQFAEQSEFSAALEEVKMLIEKYAHNPVIVSHGLSAAAQILAQHEQTNKAILLLNKVMQLKSLDTSNFQEQQLFLAKLYVQQKKYVQSLPLLDNWLSQNRHHRDRIQVHYLLAFSQYQLERYQDAIASAEQGLTEGTDDPSALLAIQFNSAFNLKAYAQAEHFAARLVQNKPQIKSYWRNWIAALSQQNKLTQALAVTEMLRLQHSFSPAEILNYVYLLLDQHLPARAARELEQSLSSGLLEDTLAHRLLLARAWEQAGDLDKAIHTLEALKQQNVDSLVRLISLYAEKKDWPSLLKLAHTHPQPLDTNEWVQMQVFQALYQSGRLEDAINLLLKLSRNAENQEIKHKAQQWLEYLQASYSRL